MADKQNYDVIFIGGGLAAGLAAILLKNQRPDLSFIILEQRTKPEIPQTWSFQTLPDNVDPSDTKVFSRVEQSWLKKFLSKSWSSYVVRFPGFVKELGIPYHSVKSSHFWSLLRADLGKSLILGETVTAIHGHKVMTASGAQFHAKQLIDARGWEEGAFAVAGYQKFVGLNITTTKPHGLTAPILMDATVPQTDGFRFIYTLPFGERELLIEDTRYSNTAEIDKESFIAEIMAYAHAQGWMIESIGEYEIGALALPSYSKREFMNTPLGPSLPSIGARAGLFHPTTGYSLYDAVLTAEKIVRACSRSLDSLAPDLEAYSRARWADQEFYRRLNNMLFYAAEPRDRYQVLERFYEHDEDLIARFYAGTTSTGDKFRIMSGRPPIPMKRAIYHFFNRSEVQHG